MSRPTNEMVQMFTMPSEYQRAAAEAKRRQRMAELLESQEYDPTVYRNAPIPAAAPLVQGLQAFIKGRLGRQADEALEKAEAADVSAMRDLFTRLGPQERTGAEAAVQDIAQSAQISQLGRDGTYTPSTIMPSTQPTRLPYTEAAPTGQERKDILMAAAASGSPRASKLAELMLSQKEEKPELPFGKIDLGKLTPESRKRFIASVEAGKPDYNLPEFFEQTNLTAKERADLGLNLGRFGIDAARLGYETGITPPPLAIPGITGPAAAAPQPAVRMPSLTPGQMRMGIGETAEAAPTPRRQVTPSVATVPPPPRAVVSTGAGGVGRLPPKARQELESTLLKENLESTKAQLASAGKAQESLIKTYKTLDLLEQGKPITGIGSEIRLTGDRLKSLFKGQPASEVTDSQLLDALLGSEVFGLVQSLGVGARGLDTPGEREFLLQVMSGTRKLDNETLREMTRLRANILEKNLDTINERINSGDLDWYFELQAPYGVRKRAFEKPRREAEVRQQKSESRRIADEILRQQGMGLGG